MASSQDAWYLSLLGLAEHFRTCNPPNIKMCIQCLQTVFHFKPPLPVEARTHLQLGNILLSHTKNTDLAREHLEKAWNLSQSLSSFDEIKFEAASVLASVYQQQDQAHLATPILRKAIEISQQSVFCHCRLLFQLAQIHALDRDYVSAISLLSVGVDYSKISGAHYTRLLFLLSKAMLLLIARKLVEVAKVLSQAGILIETWNGLPHQKEYLKVFFLVLQVSHYLLLGQVKSVKPCLKQLQQFVQTNLPSEDDFTSSNPGDMFTWLPKDDLTVLVYLITVSHSMQAGYMEKAQKYTDKTLAHIQKIKMIDSRPLLLTMQLNLLEHIIMCRLVMGNKCGALGQIWQVAQMLASCPDLAKSHKPQLHVLLGLYSMSMNCTDAAEAQFSTALRITEDNDVWTFANLNLAIVYLRTKREGDFVAMLDRINPDTLQSQSHSLRAAAYYVQGLHCFFNGRPNDAKRYLRETLKMANAEDLNRLTSCALVLLGHIFLSLQNSRETLNMVNPALHLASKIPDIHVQLWATAVLKELYRQCGDGGREQEASRMYYEYTQMLLKDTVASNQLPQHKLITWTDENFPVAMLAQTPHIPPPQPSPSVPVSPLSTGVIASPSTYGHMF